MSDKLLVPDIGDFENVEIVEVLVKAGDNIKKNDPIVTLESDKSSVEVPSDFDGKVENVNVKIGDKVSKGDLLVIIKSSNKEEKENISKKKENNISEKIPSDTEKIIKQAEGTLVLNKEVENKTNKKVINDKIIEPRIEVHNNKDIDPIETREWLDSLSAVLENDGKHRAQYLIKQLIEHSYKEGSDLVLSRNTPYINTISPEEEKNHQETKI